MRIVADGHRALASADYRLRRAAIIAATRAEYRALAGAGFWRGLFAAFRLGRELRRRLRAFEREIGPADAFYLRNG